MLAVRLPAEIETRLDNLARSTGRTKSYYAREAILEHLDDLEDLYLAERELLEIRAGRSKAIPLEEVMKQYGMEPSIIRACSKKSQATRPASSPANSQIYV